MLLEQTRGKKREQTRKSGEGNHHCPRTNTSQRGVEKKTACVLINNFVIKFKELTLSLVIASIFQFPTNLGLRITLVLIHNFDMNNLIGRGFFVPILF
jgi:hypothetical protein